MQFAFSKRYRFECKQCGVCCLQKALSLTDAEYERFTKLVDHSLYENVSKYYLTPEIRLHDVSFRGKDCYFTKKINGKKICRMYDSRFITCRLFPLAVTALPDGEILVNLVHCNGVSLDHGELVNESFVKNILDDVNSRDPSFLPKLILHRKSYHNDFFPFYTRLDLTDFWTKRHFLNRIAKWLANKTPRNKSIHVRIRAINEVLSKDLSVKLQKLFNEYGLSQPPIILTQIDVEKMANEIEEGLENRLKRISEDVELRNQNEILKILSEKKTEILVDEKLKMMSLNQKITYFTPYLDKIETKVKNLLKEKPLSNDAIQLFEDYIAEILKRVDQGGFPMSIPIIDILESLYRFFQGILTHAQVYSDESTKIEKDHLNDALVYLDTRYTLGSICARVVKEYTQGSNMPAFQI